MAESRLMAIGKGGSKKALVPTIDSWKVVDAVGKILVARTGRTVLINAVYLYEDRPIYRARVSADDRRTWGWHTITKRELVEAMA